MSTSWQDILREQQEELRRLEQMNDALDAGQGALDADIHRALKPRSAASAAAAARTAAGSTGAGAGLPRSASSRTRMASRGSGSGAPPDDEDSDFPSAAAASAGALAGEMEDLNIDMPLRMRPASDAPPALPPSPEIDGAKAPEVALRYQKARMKVLEKQVEDGKQLRAQLLEQVHDLQKQLQMEREESKKIKKRVQLLEAEQKRSATPRRGSSGPEAGAAGPTLQELQAEVANLKKDLQTAERLAKQAEANNKAKDLQIKRGTETITRLRSENEELLSRVQSSGSGDRARAEELAGRVRNLEKQRADLVDAFRKQMKLIDVLKRQKSHIEAARLLSFSEEEFLKTLDWAL